MGLFEDVRAMALAVKGLPHIPLQVLVNLRTQQRLRAMADGYNVSIEEMASGLLALYADHAPHIQIIAIDTSTHLGLFTETMVDPLVVLDDVMRDGYDVLHIRRVRGPAGATYAVSVDRAGGEIEALGSSLAGAIRSLPGEIERRRESK